MAFEFIWSPLSREAGRYLVSADRPNVTDEPAEYEFELFGADIEPNAVGHRVLAGQRIERSVTIRNLGDVELSGLSAHVHNPFDNLIVEPNCPNTLGPKAAATLKYSVKAKTRPVRDAFTVVVSCGPPVATFIRVRGSILASIWRCIRTKSPPAWCRAIRPRGR
jgi:hypothetical protein